MEPKTTRHWKEFACSPPATRTGLYASINAEGRIAINRGLWQELGSPAAVSVLYDEHNRCIGLRPASRVMPNIFPVVPIRPDKKRFWIRARHFITQAEIEISYCVRFLDPYIEDETLVLDLNHTTRVLNPRK